MADNIIDLSERTLPDDGTETLIVIPATRTNYRGMTAIPLTDDRDTSGADTDQIYDIAISSDGIAGVEDGVLHHRSIAVPFTDPSAPISFNNFFNNANVDNITTFEVFERYRTDTDIVYDVFLLTELVASADDYDLSVVTYKGKPGDSFADFTTPNNAQFAKTVLRSVEGDTRTYDVFVLEVP